MFENLIKVYDRTSSFFYLDPPYHTTEKYYDIEFTEDDHKRLASQLSQIQGKFLLSYNDDMFIRDLYRDYDIVSVSRNNNLSSGSFKELLSYFDSIAPLGLPPCASEWEDDEDEE